MGDLFEVVNCSSRPLRRLIRDSDELKALPQSDVTHAEGDIKLLSLEQQLLVRGPTSFDFRTAEVDAYESHPHAAHMRFLNKLDKHLCLSVAERISSQAYEMVPETPS